MMTAQNSFRVWRWLTANTLWLLLAQISNGGPNSTGPGLLRRGTPIDSPPETNSQAVTSSPPSALAVPALTNLAARSGGLVTNNGYAEVGFDVLSGFSPQVVYEPVTTNGMTFRHAQKMLGEIPDTIKALDTRKVAVKGFMLPLKEREGLTTEFILLRSRMMCCFGVPPNINEWIHVRTGDKGVKCIMDTPVTICGTLRVGEYRENRTMLGIYQLDGEKLAGPDGT